jgi:hypothetical protein
MSLLAEGWMEAVALRQPCSTLTGTRNPLGVLQAVVKACVVVEVGETRTAWECLRCAAGGGKVEQQGATGTNQLQLVVVKVMIGEAVALRAL